MKYVDWALAATIICAQSACGDLVTLGSSIDREPFGTPTVIAAVSTLSDDEDPSFTADELELYFMSDRSGTADIWVSHRASTVDPWGAPTVVMELSTSFLDLDPCVRPDGLSMWLTSNRLSMTNTDIFFTKRASRTDAWDPPVRIEELTTSSDDGQPSVDANGLIMVFGSTRAGGVGLHDLYQTTRLSTSDPWQAPVAISELNTPEQDRDPFIGHDGLEIFWATDTVVRAELVINWAVRPSIDAPFSTPIPLDIGTSTYDPTLSVNLRHMMFASSRLGTHDIFEAWR